MDQRVEAKALSAHAMLVMRHSSNLLSVLSSVALAAVLAGAEVGAASIIGSAAMGSACFVSIAGFWYIGRTWASLTAIGVIWLIQTKVSPHFAPIAGTTADTVFLGAATFAVVFAFMVATRRRLTELLEVGRAGC